MQDIRPPKPSNYLNIDIATKKEQTLPAVHKIEGPNPPPPDKPLTNPPIHPDNAPAVAKISVSKASPNDSLHTEVVESIPVHIAAPTPAQPINPAPIMQMPGSEADSVEPEDDLDKILQAVNSRVKTPLKAPAKPKSQAAAKLIAKASGFKNLTKNSRLAAALAVVAIMFIALSTVAVMAYRQGGKNSPALASQPGKVGTSYQAGDAIQAAGGTLVRPSDLDDFSQTLQDKLNALNDSQDFDSASLSDQTLGL